MKLLAWCDAPNAPTGFGRSANHVLGALHRAGYEITQLAVNADPSQMAAVPWRTFLPSNIANDPYGLSEIPKVLAAGPYDLFWTTFDPECPWFLGVGNPPRAVVDVLGQLRSQNPGFKMAGWFPVDAGPLSEAEMAVLIGNLFDVPVTMSPHVYDLVEWTLKLRGQKPNRKAIEQRLGMIPHGIDLARYRVPTDEQRLAAKIALGFNPDAFVILQLERNQQRKQNYLGLEVMEILLQRGIKPGAAVLYQHMLPDEETQACGLGYNLPEMAWRYGLQPGRDVIWSPGWVNESDLPEKVYACADAFLSVSCGEGFQYPAWEALACGVPLVVPNDSARAAWFKGAPNVSLYRSQDRRLVLRGGYKRRMAIADPADAARVLRKMMGKPPARGMREAGHSWIRRVASVEKVQEAWVDLMDALGEKLKEERRAAKIAVEGDAFDVVASFDQRVTPGLGDFLMVKPAIDALRRAGKRVAVQIPRLHYDLARLADVADAYLVGVPPLEGSVDLSALYRPDPDPRWHDAQENRSDLFAEKLGVAGPMLPAVQVFGDPALRAQAKAQFLEMFGADPGDCVAICGESGDPRRCMPRGHIEGVANRVRALGLTPVLMGLRAMTVKTLGVLDLTGQAQMPAAAVLLGMVRAVVSVDSAPMHMAALQQTPLVAVLPTVNSAARLAYYAGRIVCPQHDLHEGDERKQEPVWPTPIEIVAALQEVLK